MIHKVSVLMIPTGGEFICVQKKIADNRAAYFLILGSTSDLASGLCNQMKEILIFQFVF